MLRHEHLAGRETLEGVAARQETEGAPLGGFVRKEDTDHGEIIFRNRVGTQEFDAA
jgi:hypothetical protein